MNFEREKSARDLELMELELRKKEILEELDRLHNLNREDLETEISNKEADILDVKNELAPYRTGQGAKEEFNFDDYPADVVITIQNLIAKQKMLIAEKRELEMELNGDPQKAIDLLLDELKKVNEELGQ